MQLHQIPEGMFRGREEAAVLPSSPWGGAACLEGGEHWQGSAGRGTNRNYFYAAVLKLHFTERKLNKSASPKDTVIITKNGVFQLVLEAKTINAHHA